MTEYNPIFDTALSVYIRKATDIAWKKKKAVCLVRDYLVNKKFLRLDLYEDGYRFGIHSFVELSTGNVYKAKTAKSPEKKYIRGNIYDEWNGCKNMGSYGPVYSR
jgi:hypothetical protein